MGLVPIYRNHITFAQDLCHRQLKKTERSDTTNQKSKIKNRQSNSLRGVGALRAGGRLCRVGIRPHWAEKV